MEIKGRMDFASFRRGSGVVKVNSYSVSFLFPGQNEEPHFRLKRSYPMPYEGLIVIGYPTL